MLAWDDKACDTVVSHYGEGLHRGTSQLVPRPAPHNPRRFTAREVARLMGFPDGFDIGITSLGCSLSSWSKSRYRMLGNAVTPPVVAALSGAILAQSRAVAPDLDWAAIGRSCAVELALQATAPRRRHAVLSGLHPSFRHAHL